MPRWPASEVFWVFAVIWQTGVMNRVPVPLRGVRLCLRDHQGVIRKVARLDWSDQDTSLYITSYCPPGGRTFAGRFKLSSGVPSTTWDFTGQLEAGETMPKMSLHESGQTKTELGGKKSRFVIGQPLFDAVGGHVATIKTFNAGTLPILEKKAKGGASDIIAEGDGAPYTSVRFPISVHITESGAFMCKFPITFRRPHLASPLYVGIDVVGEFEPHNDGDGVVVIGGWGPALLPSEVGDVAFTVTQSTPIGNQASGRSHSVASSPPGSSRVS